MPVSDIMEYAGFWRRLGAFWVDTIVWLPIIGFSIWGGEQSRMFPVYWLVPSIAIALWFHVYLVKRYGGTPGKLLLKIIIVKLNGNEVGYKEALLRHSVTFVISVILGVLVISVVVGMSNTEYFSVAQQGPFIMMYRAFAWYSYISIALSLWIYTEFVVMLANQKRRTVHDFMAGTVVVNNSEQVKRFRHRASRKFDYKALARN